MELSQEEIGRITQFLNINAEPKHADVAVLFGGRFFDPAFIAAALFKCKVVKHIVVTGGMNHYTQANEAHVHRDILLEQGIPQDCIIVEDESTNTLENVLFLLPRLSAVVDLDSIKSIVAVTKWYHCRRAIMTLKAHLPRGLRYFSKTYEPEGTTQIDWPLSEQGRKRVLKEWEVIPEYLGKGNIAQIQKADGYYI